MLYYYQRQQTGRNHQAGGGTEGGIYLLKTDHIEQSPLFRGICGEDLCRLLSSLQPSLRTFQPEERVYDFSSDSIGMIEQGEAVLLRVDRDGAVTVLEELWPGGLFGRALAFSSSAADGIEVRCRRACTVTWIDCASILRCRGEEVSGCGVLLQNLLRLTVEQMQLLSQRVDVLSRRSIREKLLCCFRQFSRRAGGGSFTLPFSLDTLADYIATDRSAMMRELKKLRAEGIVRSDGRKFTLSASKF